jgi:DNA-binding PadR family transcriptional regulator
MSLKYVLLALIAQRPHHGYELKHQAEQLLGSGAELNPGQLYPLLRKLAEQRLLTDERVEQEDRPDKRVFTLTEAGARELEAWLAEPVPLQVGRSPLFLRFVVLALMKPEACAEFLRRQRRVALEFLARLVADRAERQHSDDLATSALREATILHAEADLRWIEWLEARSATTGAATKEQAR